MKKIELLLPLAVLYTGLFAIINTFEDSYTIKNLETGSEQKSNFGNLHCIFAELFKS